MERFWEVYPCKTPEETIRSQIQMYSDSGFGHGMYVWSGLQNTYGQADVYLYDYCHPMPDTDLGAHHSSELFYLFRKLGYRPKHWTAKDYELQDIYSGYLVNFVRTGTPNGDGLPVWESFRSDPEQIMILDDEPHMAKNPTLAAMRFWDDLAEQ